MDASLESRLKRLMLFRVVMVTTLLMIAAYVEAVSENLLPVNPLYFLILATYALTVFHALALRFVRSLVAQVYAQVLGDLVIITGLVYTTGGVRAGFMLLYPISVLSGSVMLPRRGGLVLAGLATVLYAGTLGAVRLALVPAQGLADVPFLPLRAILYSIFITGVACGTVALIGAYLAESLRHVGQKLHEASVQVADLQKLNEIIVNSIQSGLMTTDGDGYVLHVNAFGEAILGRAASSTRGHNAREVFGSSLFEPLAMKARAARRSLARLELDYRRPDGAAVKLGVSVAPLASGGPAAGGHLLVFQDLTEVKRLEQEVQTKEKLAAVGEMAAQLAHEIRNPLGSISGSAQVLMAEPNMSAEQERLLAIITRESKRLSQALNQFLFQTRSGLPLGPVDIGPLIGEAVTLLRNGPEVGPDHVVECEIGDGPHVCLADPDQISQVFWNLARNGLEAMPRGGVLRVRVARTPEEVVLSVRDEGRGISSEEQRSMFEPFRSRSRVGTGLGLAIVYRIVREHRGDISVRSVPWEGTQVDVRLPLVPVSAGAPIAS